MGLKKYRGTGCRGTKDTRDRLFLVPKDTRDRLFLVHGGDLKEPVPDFDAISKWVGVAVLFLIQGKFS
jgi:hypothetical protein